MPIIHSFGNILKLYIEPLIFLSERNIVGMEILSHSLPLLLSKKDLGDGTILPGDWRLKQDIESSKSLLEPMPQIFIFR